VSYVGINAGIMTYFEVTLSRGESNRWAMYEIIMVFCWGHKNYNKNIIDNLLGQHTNVYYPLVVIDAQATLSFFTNSNV
jgi:hypothetical protein